VDVVGCDEVDPSADRQLGEDVVALRVEWVAVVPELDGDVVSTEGGDEAVERPTSCCGAIGEERGGEGAFAAPSEHVPRSIGRRTEILERHREFALLPSGEVGISQHGREAGVPQWPLSEEDQVLAGGIWHTGPRCPTAERDFDAEDGGEAERPSCSGEPNHAVEPVVIGEGECRKSEANGFGDEFFGITGAVEEAES
jgi:hypothetical protein